MKTLDLITGTGNAILCIFAVVLACVQKRWDLLAIAFVTGLMAVVLLAEYKSLKRKENDLQK
jgi:hypothetical protein